MRLFREFVHETGAQAAVSAAVTLPICIYAFFFLMFICLSLYSASVVKDTAMATLHYVQSHGGEMNAIAPGAGVDTSDVPSTAGAYASAYFAETIMNPVQNEPPNTCVSWWQPGTTVGPYRYADCANGSGEGSYSFGNGDPDSAVMTGQEVAVQVTWRYQPWVSHLFPTPSTFSYTAVGPLLN